MSTQAMIGYGTLLEIKTGSPPDYQEISEVVNISGPSGTRDAIDATHMQSPDMRREFIPGLIDEGEVSVELNHIPGSGADALLRAAFSARDRVWFRITEPGSPSVQVEFEAVVTAYSKERPVDGKMTASATFKISGKVLYNGA